MKLIFNTLLYFCVITNAGGTENYIKKSNDIKDNYNKYEYRIPMRDGITLFTAIYIPKDTTEKYPLLLMRTPYRVIP